VIDMLEGITVINVMADGSICDDLSTYIGPEHPLPENTSRIIAKLIRDGWKQTKP
jgi:hypothetical protein